MLAVAPRRALFGSFRKLELGELPDVRLILLRCRSQSDIPAAFRHHAPEVGQALVVAVDRDVAALDCNAKRIGRTGPGLDRVLFAHGGCQQSPALRVAECAYRADRRREHLIEIFHVLEPEHDAGIGTAVGILGFRISDVDTDVEIGEISAEVADAAPIARVHFHFRSAAADSEPRWVWPRPVRVSEIVRINLFALAGQGGARRDGQREDYTCDRPQEHLSLSLCSDPRQEIVTIRSRTTPPWFDLHRSPPSLRLHALPKKQLAGWMLAA